MIIKVKIYTKILLNFKSQLQNIRSLFFMLHLYINLTCLMETPRPVCFWKLARNYSLVNIIHTTFTPDNVHSYFQNLLLHFNFKFKNTFQYINMNTFSVYHSKLICLPCRYQACGMFLKEILA